MDCIYHLNSPLGPLLLSGNENALTGLWLEGQRHYGSTLAGGEAAAYLPVFRETEGWLERYFSGTDPGQTPPLAPRGTAFQQEVWAWLRTVPWGGSVTYGEIAAGLSEPGRRVSPRAVGGAVGRNPISVLIPCHRVQGAGGRLAGYAGGLERKAYLLRLERGK